RKRWAEGIQTEAPFIMEFRLRGKDGVCRWYRSRAVPIRNEQGELTRWYGTASDIDDLKRAADRLGEILGHVEEPFFALVEENISYLNPAAERMIGSPDRGFVGKNFFQVLPEVDKPEFRTGCLQAMREGREMSFETRLTQAPHEGAFSVRIFPNVE